MSLHQLNDASLLKTDAFINGRWVKTGQHFNVFNPATGEVLAEVASCTTEHTREAISSADVAYRSWSAQTAKQRAGILRNWFNLMLQHKQDLAMIMTAEQGKPLAESEGEIAYAASFVEWFAEEGKRIYGDTIPSPAGDKRIITVKQPIGVCAAITPWNFPAAMITRKVAPALAVGCAVVVKPAELTPLSALALAELADRAGFPPGVFNVVMGDVTAIGAELTANKTVRKLSFTGSTDIGKLLMGQSAATVKKLSLELGGNAPFIVFDDADLDAAVEGAVQSKYRNTGQTCICTNRFLIQDGIYDAFAEKLACRVATMTVGSGFDPQSVQGPLIDERALEKVERHVHDAVAKGARILTGGKRHSLGRTFYQPTVLADVSPQMLCCEEETFGPVAALTRFSDESEATDIANDTDSGLAGYLYSRDISRVWRVAEALEYGMVGVNTGAVSNEVAPFGGIKQSGIGREGSRYGVEDYLELKYICLGGIE
ncbi:NAD-dependent succinate-semialdehyde dehydrogenase [Aliamphritea hakodatensis]|uniref:NAD-dependent succinate-semialdehyde dehydrogenase n=1 Tax=Aliamphritea hakodatensis TaxID=2895352 RepID=UPI0022FD8096|nr:NAD-dependent succinate-semialdehyde dehydrogenase [Aliamphritea hakodatensis]